MATKRAKKNPALKDDPRFDGLSGVQLPPGHPDRTRGMPSDYRPEMCPQVEKLCLLGATDLELADFFNIGITTLRRWRIKYPEFAAACQTGKDAADDRVEQALYHRAIGYEYEATKILADGTKVSYREVCPPDTAAAFIWLKNRRRNEWRDRKEVEVGGPGDFDRLTDDELKEFIQARASRISQSDEGTGTSGPTGLSPKQLN